MLHYVAGEEFAAVNLSETAAARVCLRVCHSLLEEGLPASEMFWCVDYIAVQTVLSAHPGFIDVVTNIPRLSANEVVNGDRMSESSQKRIMRPELNSLVLLKYIGR